MVIFVFLLFEQISLYVFYFIDVDLFIIINLSLNSSLSLVQEALFSHEFSVQHRID